MRQKFYALVFERKKRKARQNGESEVEEKEREGERVYARRGRKREKEGGKRGKGARYDAYLPARKHAEVRRSYCKVKKEIKE